MSLLEQDTTRKGWVNEKTTQLEFEAGDGDGEEFEVEGIQDSAVYVGEPEGHLLGLYYLVSWKGYPEEGHWWSYVCGGRGRRRLLRIASMEGADQLS